MQRVDVMMMPIDSMTNLGFEELLQVIQQVGPPIVIPMHYDAPRQAEIFAASSGSAIPFAGSRRPGLR